MAPAIGTAGGIGDKIRGAMAVGKTRWGMLALVFSPPPLTTSTAPHWA